MSISRRRSRLGNGFTQSPTAWWWAPALFLCLVTLFSGGCKDTSDESEFKEITLFTMQLRPTFDEYFFERFAEFERTHPGVKIRWMDQPYQNYETKLITTFIAESAPDVINLPNESVPTFARAQFITELEPLLPQEVFDSYVPLIIQEGCKYQGKIYSLPWYVSTPVTMCNRKVFEEAGIDFTGPPQYNEELPEICRQIQENTDKFGFFQTYAEAGSLATMIVQVRVPLLDESRTRAIFNQPRAVKAVEFWTDLYRQGLVPSECLTSKHRRPIELYKSGRLAILHIAPQFLRQVKADAPDVYRNTVVGPQIHWRDHAVYKIEMHTIAVSRQSKHPNLAAELAAFLTNAESQMKFCKLTTILPSVSAALKDPFFSEPDDTPEGQARAFSAHQVANGIVVLPPPKASKVYVIFNEITTQICLGKLSASEGLQLAEERVNEILLK